MVEVDDHEVRIGEAGNLVKLTPAEWTAAVLSTQTGPDVWVVNAEDEMRCGTLRAYGLNTSSSSHIQLGSR